MGRGCAEAGAFGIVRVDVAAPHVAGEAGEEEEMRIGDGARGTIEGVALADGVGGSLQGEARTHGDIPFSGKRHSQPGSARCP